MLKRRTQKVRPTNRGPTSRLSEKALLGLLLFYWAFIPQLQAAEEPTATAPKSRYWGSRSASSVPDDAFLLRNGAVIGRIYFDVRDIFTHEEPGRQRFLYDLANRLHINTRPTVIEQKLLFREGDTYDPRRLQETARYLRSQDFIFDATIKPVAYYGNRVDILVVTRDVWTLGLGAGLERSGGANSVQFQLEESNLLGTGRYLDIKFSNDPDRRSSRFRFIDSAILGTRAELKLWYADNSDGHRQVFDLSHPFFSLDKRWAATFKIISDRREERIYEQGEVVDLFGHDSTLLEISGGLSKGYVNGRTRRWFLGYTMDRDRFDRETFSDPPADIFSVPGPNHVPGGFDEPGFGVGENPNKGDRPLPSPRTHSYVWVGMEEVVDKFVELRNMDQLNRTEDFNLGREWSFRLGWSTPSLGGEKNQAIFSAGIRSGWLLGERQTFLMKGHASGRWGSDGHENMIAGGELRYYLRNFKQHRFHALIRADAAWNLDGENQLLLGGDSGLRGYPRRFRDGDRRLLVSLEQRFYTNWEILDLVNVGAACFFDIGSAWNDRPLSNEDEIRFLKDVGFGLRLSSSRSSKGRMVHLDVAFPLDGDTEDVQWLVTSQNSF